jgi:hypothetical protein
MLAIAASLRPGLLNQVEAECGRLKKVLTNVTEKIITCAITPLRLPAEGWIADLVEDLF